MSLKSSLWHKEHVFIVTSDGVSRGCPCSWRCWCQSWSGQGFSQSGHSVSIILVSMTRSRHVLAESHVTIRMLSWGYQELDERMKGKLILTRSKTCCDVACDILVRVALKCDVCDMTKSCFVKPSCWKFVTFNPLQMKVKRVKLNMFHVSWSYEW